MATCPVCRQIFWGGVKSGGTAYCSQKCVQMVIGQAMAHVPQEVLGQRISEVHLGSCPQCKGPGPNEYFESYHIYSFLIMTRWYSNGYVCCKTCANRKARNALIQSLLLGWWGFPWGLVITPVQAVYNIQTMRRQIVEGTPSSQFKDAVGRLIVANALQQQSVPGEPSTPPPD